MPHKFDLSRISLLDSQSRRKLLNPEELPSQLPLSPSATVADIGCGTGFFTLPLAKALPQGRVLAVDVLEEMLERVRQRVREEGLNNVETVRSSELDIPLPERSLDGLLVAFVLHEIDERQVFLTHLRGLLKGKGWLALIEWVKKEMPYGPPLDVRIDKGDARELLSKAGFRVETEKGLGENYYFILAFVDEAGAQDSQQDKC